MKRSDLDIGIPKAGPSKTWPVLATVDGTTDAGFEGVEVWGREICEVAGFGLFPDVLGWIQIGRVRGEKLNVNRGRGVVELSLEFPDGRGVDVPIVQDEYRRAGKIFRETMQKVADIITVEILSLHIEPEASHGRFRFERERNNRREIPWSRPTPDRRRLADRGPGAFRRWIQLVSGFIDKDDQLVIRPGFF